LIAQSISIHIQKIVPPIIRARMKRIIRIATGKPNSIAHFPSL
jgi:hypothetical protein